MIQYAQIVFQQGDDANEALEILTERGKQACVDYLAQWDNGDTGLEFRNVSASGTSDRLFQSGEYVLSYNLPLGYVGLERIVGKPADMVISWKNSSFAPDDADLVPGNSCLLAFHDDGKVYIGAIGGYVNGQWQEADNSKPLKPLWYYVLPST